ncbi:MAG TPA: hypothetical protein VMV38_00395 [Candidatus Paceibacterota bacterium]|nr:hypothetical protein [Candidatus Paceibacterota bacterium]
MNTRIIPGLAFVVALGIFFFYVNPTWTGSIAKTNAAIAADNQALAAAQEYTARQDSLVAARNAIDPANLAALATFLPSSVDNVGMVLDLNALASRSGLSVSNIDVITNDTSSAANTNAGTLPATGANPVGSVDLSLSAFGTFDSLQSFLVGVESSQRLLDVRDLTIKGSTTGVYTYQMILRLYWLH